MTLRIQRAVRGAVPVLSLSGRLQLEQLPELRRLLDDEPDRRQFALDLKELTLVDKDGVRFLGGLEAAGTTLENCPGYIREWIRGEQGRG